MKQTSRVDATRQVAKRECAVAYDLANGSVKGVLERGHVFFACGVRSFACELEQRADVVRVDWSLAEFTACEEFLASVREFRLRARDAPAVPDGIEHAHHSNDLSVAENVLPLTRDRANVRPARSEIVSPNGLAVDR